MSKIELKIDGQKVSADKGMKILEAAKKAEIYIPTLCYHEKLKPFAACRLCIVEVESKGKTKLVASCVYPAKNDIIVRTRSPKVDKLRKTIIELLMAHAPHSPKLLELADEYGVVPDRFSKEPSFCIHCGLCVRYCAEVAKKNAVKFVEKGIYREISFVSEIAAKECYDCKECFPLCPTSYLQAAFVFAESLAFPKSGK